MKLSTTFLFTVLFAAVLAVYLKTRPPSLLQDPVKKVFEIPSRKLLDLRSADQVVWLQLQNLEQQTTITLIKRDGSWYVKFPLEDYADDELVHEMIKKLLSIYRQKIYQPEKDWEEYGLAKPGIKVGIETTQWTERRYLYLGDVSPIENMLFARWSHEEGYFLVSPDIMKILHQSLYSLREKRVFRRDLSQLLKITFYFDAKRYDFQKGVRGWELALPNASSQRLMDSKKMEDLIGQLTHLMVKDFVAEPQELAKISGISKENSFVEVQFKEGLLETVYLGNEFPLRDSYFSKRENEAQLFFLDRKKIRHLFESVAVFAQGTEATRI